MDKNQKRLALIIVDLIVFVFSMLGLIFTLADVRFMGDYPRLSSIPYLMTFTGLSNVFIGLVCLLCAVTRLVKKDEPLPVALFLIKIIALAEISITFITTATYLVPSVGNEWWRRYLNASLFNHLLTPVTAIVGFLLLEERVEIPFNYCFFSIVPIVLYTSMYLINILNHLKPDGGVDSTYDIYGFLRFGYFTAPLFFIGFIGLSFGFTVLYRFQNKQKRSK